MGEKEPIKDASTTHGICDECTAKMLGKIEKSQPMHEVICKNCNKVITDYKNDCMPYNHMNYCMKCWNKLSANAKSVLSKGNVGRDWQNHDKPKLVETYKGHKIYFNEGARIPYVHKGPSNDAGEVQGIARDIDEAHSNIDEYITKQMGSVVRMIQHKRKDIAAFNSIPKEDTEARQKFILDKVASEGKMRAKYNIYKQENDMIDQSVQEEKDAQRNYDKRADKLEERGDDKDAEVLRHIIPDEAEHERELKNHKLEKDYHNSYVPRKKFVHRCKICEHANFDTIEELRQHRIDKHDGKTGVPEIDNKLEKSGHGIRGASRSASRLMNTSNDKTYYYSKCNVQHNRNSELGRAHAAEEQKYKIEKGVHASRPHNTTPKQFLYTADLIAQSMGWENHADALHHRDADGKVGYGPAYKGIKKDFDFDAGDELYKMRPDNWEQMQNTGAIESDKAAIHSEAQPQLPKTDLQRKIIGDIKYLEEKSVDIEKQSKKYIHDGENPPNNEPVQQGKAGGKFYTPTATTTQKPADLQSDNPTNIMGDNGQSPEEQQAAQTPMAVEQDEMPEPEPEIIPNKSNKLQQDGFVEIDKEKLLSSISTLINQNDKIESKTKPAPEINVTKSLSNINKSIDILTNNNNVDMFLLGYENLSFNSSSMYINNLFGIANSINKSLDFGCKASSWDSVGQILYIDSIAHELHLISKGEKPLNNTQREFFYGSLSSSVSNSAGVSSIGLSNSAVSDTQHPHYDVLDKLAKISKAAGEQYREDRLLILNKAEVKKFNSITVFKKSIKFDTGKSYWNIAKKCIKEGADALSDDELITLREWIYARI